MSNARYVIPGEHDGHKFEWDLSLGPMSSKPAPLVTCPECHGSCKPHFGMMDDPVNCFRCRNTGKVPDPSFIWNPEPPKELVDALRKVWKDHWNKIQNDNFTLT